MNLINEACDSDFVTRKMEHFQWSIKRDLGNELIYNTEVLKSNLCDYNDAYILVKGNITIAGNIAAQVVLNICAPFIYLQKLMEDQ